DSSVWSKAIGELRAEFKYIVIDSSPAGCVADYDLLEATCDGVVLVIRPDHTNRSASKKALEAVRKNKLLGIVLNCLENWFLTKQTVYAYGYGYSHGLGSADHPEVNGVGHD